MRYALVVSALLGAASLTYRGIRVAQDRGLGADRSVAVLTFETIGSDADAEYLAQGLADGITTSLGGVKRLTVVSRAAVRHGGDRQRLGTAQLGASLHAAQLVSGSVQRVGSRLLVIVELVRASSGEQLWAARYDTTATDVLGIEAVVAEAVAQRIAGRLLSRERTQVALRPTESPAAYDHYLRGNRLLWVETEPAVLGAIAEYETALHFDSSFVSAMGRLAYAYGLSLNWGYRPGSLPADSVLARGLSVADRAIRRDSLAPDAWMGRGAMLLYRGSVADYEAGADAFRRAVSLDPLNDAAHHWLGTALRRLGRLDEAVLEYHRALANNPARLQSMADLGFIAFSQRSYDVAASWYARCNAVDSTVAATHSMIAMSRSFAGDRAGGLREGQVTAALASEAERPRALAMLAELEVRAGQRSSARAHLRDALRAVGATPDRLPTTLGVRNWWQIAGASAMLGERDLALTIVERLRPRGPWLWSYLIFEDFDAVRADPRFRKIFDASRPPRAMDPRETSGAGVAGEPRQR
ncbi:MAG: tetratricopeptide repeat protein [Gemmatimonadaceae bacterium]